MKNLKLRLERIANVLDNKKAEQIELIELEGRDYIADAVVIATSLNDRHGLSLLNELKNELKPEGEEFVAIDDNTGEWVVVDLGDIIIHIMTLAYREKYTIEKFLEELKEGKLTPVAE